MPPALYSLRVAEWGNEIMARALPSFSKSENYVRENESRPKSLELSQLIDKRPGHALGAVGVSEPTWLNLSAAQWGQSPEFSFLADIAHFVILDDTRVNPSPLLQPPYFFTT